MTRAQSDSAQHSTICGQCHHAAQSDDVAAAQSDGRGHNATHKRLPQQKPSRFITGSTLASNNSLSLVVNLWMREPFLLYLGFREYVIVAESG